MKKVKVQLPVKDWGTTKTKYPQDSIYVGPDDFTEGSQNFDTNSKGVITKRLGGVQYSTLPNPPQDQYEAIFSDGVHHLLNVEQGHLYYTSGDQVEHLVTSGYSSSGNFEFAEYLDRVYFDNAIDLPQVYDRSTTYGGVTYTAPRTKNMGAQAPTTAVTFAADTAGGNVPAGAHTYKVTFEYYGFEESNGGPASVVHTVVSPNNTVNLTSVPIGGYGVTSRNIYRDNNDGVYLLVGSIADNTTTIFTDTALTGTTPIPTDHGLPPTFGLIVQYLSRNWVAEVPGSPSTLFFSEAGLPDIFRGLNFISCDPADPISALVVYQGLLIILNKHSIGQILGTDFTSFAYSPLYPNVGCVDNRSVQIRTIDGVPTLIWLSDKGFWGFNGSSFQYLSDDIEDLVNFNIAQGQTVKGSNSQNTQTQFQGDTSSPSIDLLTNPGFIQTIQPDATFNDEDEWESGSLTNISTHDGSNTIKVPTQFAPNLADGTFSNTVQTGSSLTLSTGSSFSGESHLPTTSTTPFPGSGAIHYAAQPVSVPINGTITSVTVSFVGNGTNNMQLMIWNDALGNPGSVLFTSPLTVPPNLGLFTPSNVTMTCSVSVAPGTYWIGTAHATADGGTNFYESVTGQSQLFSAGTPLFSATGLAGSWTAVPASDGPGNALTIFSAYTFTQTAVPESGQWTSIIYDSFSDSVSTGMSVTMSGSYPTGTSSVITINGSNNADMSSSTTSQNISNLNGISSLTTSGARYWQIMIQLSTTDSRNVPITSSPVLFFNIVGTWISPVIDTTSDVQSYDALNITDSIPAGTSVVTTVATSANNITYTSFVPFGSAVVQRYIKIKHVLTTTSNDVTTPNVSFTQLQWTVQGIITSSIIDTGVNPPAGWDIFQAVFHSNGGAVQFFFRAADTTGGIPLASFVSVTNGSFPNFAPHQFAQWKIVITQTDAILATVESITVNWFISQTISLRVASIFYNRVYYMAAAEAGHTTNNIVITYDDRNKWRVYRGLSVNTFSFFFNNPYYGDALVGRIVKWLQGTTDLGTNIDLVVKTKAFDFAEFEHYKTFRKLYLKGTNTGAVYTISYSTDDGNTFFPTIVETQNGASQLTTDTSGTLFTHRFLPSYPNQLQGKTIMFKIEENTTNTVMLHNLTAEAWIRQGELITNA